jgi:Ca-activated chloride channel family protein
MQSIADTTGGQAFQATSAAELDTVCENIQSHVGYEVAEREILRAFLAVGLVALLVGAAASMIWTARFL